jgi:hypothetical protein
LISTLVRGVLKKRAFAGTVLQAERVWIELVDAHLRLLQPLRERLVQPHPRIAPSALTRAGRRRPAAHVRESTPAAHSTPREKAARRE